jgi:hypothetical protein
VTHQIADWRMGLTRGRLFCRFCHSEGKGWVRIWQPEHGTFYTDPTGKRIPSWKATPLMWRRLGAAFRRHVKAEHPTRYDEVFHRRTHDDAHH